MNITVELSIGGRTYPVSCSEAEAPRIRELGKILSRRFYDLANDLKGCQATDAHIMVLLNLMALDDLEKADKAVQAAEAKADEAANAVAVPPPANDVEETALIVKAVEHLTGRVNLIAKQLRAA